MSQVDVIRGWKRVRAIVVATALLYTPAPRVAAVEAQSNDIVALDGQFGGAVSVIALDGRYGYVGVGPRVAVLDRSEPGQPTLAGWSDTLPEATRDMALAGGRLIVTGINHGVFVLEIDPATGIPRLDQRLTVEGRAYQVVARGHHAYTTTPLGLHVIDVAPGGPARVVGTLPLPGLRILEDFNLVLQDDRLYLGDRDAGVGIIDIRSPEDPIVLGWNEDLSVRRIAVGDGFVAAYTIEETPSGSFDSAIQILSLDPSTLLQPVGRIALDPGGSVGPIVALGRMLFFVGRGFSSEQDRYVTEVVTMAMDDLTSPEVVGRLGAPSQGDVNSGFSAWRPRQMVVDGGRLYLAVNGGSNADSTRSGVVAYRIDGLGVLSPAGEWLEEMPSVVQRAEPAGDYLLISEHLSGVLRLYRAAPDGGLEALGLLPTFDGVQEITASGRWLYYVSYAHTLYAVDLIDPHRPTVVASMDMEGVRVLVADGERVYLGRDVPSEIGGTDRSVDVYGLSAEGGFVLQGGLASVCDSHMTDMEFAGGHLVVTCFTDGLIVLDIADPTQLRRVAQVPIGYRAHALAIDGDLAIVATEWLTPADERALIPRPRYGGVQIVDLRTLQEIGSHRTRLDRLGGVTSAEWDIAVIDGIALLTSKEKSVRLIDVREPEQPIEVQVLDLPTAVGELAVAGHVVYVSGENAGVYRLRWLLEPLDRTPQALYLPFAFRRR